MNLTPHIDELQRQLAVAAAAGDTAAQQAAERLAAALEPAARLTILEALSEAAGEITGELAPGSIDVRLRGRDVDFVVTGLGASADTDEVAEPAAPETPPSVTEDAGATSRTTIRLPDSLKERAERAAAAEGVSLNAWFVKAVAASLEGSRGARQTRGTRIAGWMR